MPKRREKSSEVGCHQRLAALRVMAGIGVKEAARTLGMPMSKYLALERGAVPITEAIVNKVAAVYDIPPELVCGDGPLPIPRAFGNPMKAEDELSDLLFTLWELYEKIDRYRQAAGESWPTYKGMAENMVGYTMFVPFPRHRIVLYPGQPVTIWFDHPHVVSMFGMGGHRVEIRVSQRNKPTYQGLGPVEVGPGRVVIESTHTTPISVRVRPVL